MCGLTSGELSATGVTVSDLLKLVKTHDDNAEAGYELRSILCCQFDDGSFLSPDRPLLSRVALLIW